MNRDLNIVNRTCNHQCSRCGDCCGLFIPFTEKELSIIKKFVSENKILPINHITGETLIAKCCFYDDINKKCLIYPVRPYVCQDFKCDHKDWLKRRDKYEKRAKYNSTLNSKFIIATFDDKIYNNYEPLLQYIITTLMNSLSTNLETEHLINFLKRINRLDLLEHITLTTDENKVIDGKDLISK